MAAAPSSYLQLLPREICGMVSFYLKPGSRESEDTKDHEDRKKVHEAFRKFFTIHNCTMELRGHRCGRKRDRKELEERSFGYGFKVMEEAKSYDQSIARCTLELNRCLETHWENVIYSGKRLRESSELMEDWKKFHFVSNKAKELL